MRVGGGGGGGGGISSSSHARLRLRLRLGLRLRLRSPEISVQTYARVAIWADGCLMGSVRVLGFGLGSATALLQSHDFFLQAFHLRRCLAGFPYEPFIFGLGLLKHH